MGNEKRILLGILHVCGGDPQVNVPYSQDY